MEFKVGRQIIGRGNPSFVIAEIGINHEGSVEACAKMIRAAAEAGADAVKLQTVDPEENYAPGTESHAIFSQAELTREETARMFELARQLGLEVFTTAGDFNTLEWVEALEPSAHKISSGLLTSTPIIRAAAKTGRPLLMSTGMAETEAIDRAVEAAKEAGCQALALFQCTSIYPAPPETLNLRTIGWLEERYGIPCGFSDHSRGIQAAPLAVAAGASMIEKHFSLDLGREGFDHRLSLSPEDFAEMVNGIRSAEAMLGTPEKSLATEEQVNAGKYHRVLAARRDVDTGKILGRDDVAVLRLAPGSGGLEPGRFESLMGKRALVALKRFSPIREEDVE